MSINNWIDSSDRIVFQDPSVDESGSSFALCRKDILDNWLEENGGIKNEEKGDKPTPSAEWTQNKTTVTNGITTYVSRRYVPKLKKILGI